MSVVILVEWHIQPDRIETVRELLQATFAGTQQYEGCRRYEIYESQESIGNVFLLTEWDSKEDYAQYIAWRKETGVLDQFGQTFADPPSVRYLQAI